jgi:DNA-binding NtrC family response regulator
MDARLLLIVDDSLTVAEALATTLSAVDLQVIVCSDRESAEVVLGRQAVDFLLTDIRINPPFGYEGLDLIREFKERNPAGLAVAMTGYISDEVILESRRRGAAAILQKPFSLSDVEALFVEDRHAYDCA